MKAKFELTTQYDSRKSFYRKAMVEREGDTLTLYSYDTPVAIIRGGEFQELDYFPHSRTTARHIREFRLQFERA